MNDELLILLSRASVDPAGERLGARARTWLRRVGEHPAGERTAGSRAAATDTLRLKAGDGILIDRVDIDGEPADARHTDGELVLPLPREATDHPSIVVVLEYELHELRRELGDETFWRGFQRFTTEGFRAPAGVTTDDLRRAMEAASGRELAGFFERWAYARNTGLGE